MRIYASNSDPLDFCWDCFPKTEQKAFDLYGNVGDGPDERGNCFAYDAEAPWFYEDDGSSDYECECCGCKLTERNSAWSSPEAVPLTEGIKGHFEYRPNSLGDDYYYYVPEETTA